MINISIWSDFACPYCYIGETRLYNAIRDLGIADKVKIQYHAYELDPHAAEESTLTAVERLERKYRMDRGKAVEKVEEISQLGRDMGLDFNYAGARYSNTRAAHRLLKLAEDKYPADTVDRLNVALFDAYFAKNLVLSDHEVLASVAASAGLDADEVARVLNSDEYADQVMADEHEAAMRGVRGVPYFVFKGKFAVPGAVSTEDFKEILMRELRDMPEDRPLTGDHPHNCGPNGCDLA